MARWWAASRLGSCVQRKRDAVKVGLVSSCVPLVYGGGRNIVEWLHAKLLEHGQQSEIVYIPNTDTPDAILEQMTAFRLLRLEDSFDRVITFRPPAHVVQHPVKVIWFIHHIRMYYDLWNTPYCPIPDTAASRALRAAIMRADTVALREARTVFCNSRIVGERLLTFNGVKSEVLYPPVLRPELFTCGEYGDEIVCISRMEHHKRQHLLLEAMRYTRSAVRLRLCGASTSPEYAGSLRELVANAGLGNKVVIEDRWISDEDKVARFAGALATAYVPLDEDSYGYSTIEAAHARRCTVTLSDAGGVLEFVADGENGYVLAPDPEAIGHAFDRLYADRALAQEMGESAHEQLQKLGINWQRVLDRLLA